ncbi:MAG: hypothetical protein J5595_05945 [Bacteroidales bacterium]|nr:hypothetical protein [Bacteroidales bacterium]
MRKRLSFYLAAVALAAATVFSSCVADDKDNEDDEIRNDLSFLYIKASRTASKNEVLPADPNWAINTNVFAKSSKSIDADASATGIKGKLSDLFADSPSRTTIYGFNDNEFMSITYNGKCTKDISFDEEIGGVVPALMLEYLETGKLTEEMKTWFKFSAFIIYKSSADNLWFSYKCTINPSELKVKNVSYIQGTFTAQMMNKAGDTFYLTPGSFSCLGY